MINAGISISFLLTDSTPKFPKLVSFVLTDILIVKLARYDIKSSTILWFYPSNV